MEHNMDTKRDDKEICDKCGGNGFYMYLKTSPVENHWFQSCGQCNGSGTIDWIQKIIRKETITPVGHILEDFYFKATGNLVMNAEDEIKMLFYCYHNSKVLKKD